MIENQTIYPEKSSGEGFTLFPNEENDGIVISESERIVLHGHYSKIYSAIISIVARRYEKLFSLSNGCAKDIVSLPIVTVLHVFFDRTYRINKAIDISKNKLSTIRIKDQPVIYSLGEFSSKTSADPYFNQYLISKFGKIWNLDEENKSVVCTSEDTHQKSFINHNSRLYLRVVHYAVFHRFLSIIKKITNLFFFPKILSFGMSTLHSAFILRGVYGRYVKPIAFDWKYNLKLPDKLLRNTVFDDEMTSIDEIDDLLCHIGVKNTLHNAYKTELIVFLKENFPIEYLEMVPDFIQLSKNELAKYNCKYILTGAISAADVSCFFAVAKDSGVKSIKLQHGGYYGYYKNLMWTNEFSSADYYLTWGWGDGNIGNTYRNLVFVPSISPWLSERKKFWSTTNIIKRGNYDVLIVPTRLVRFSSITGINGIDDVVERSSVILEMVKKLSSEGIKILYKSPSLRSLKDYNNTLNKLKEDSSVNFDMIDKIDKGLTVELLSKVSIIIWDTIGTGFLECMACNIPSIAIIPSYLLINDEFKPLLLDLEGVGVIHTTPDTIPDVIHSYNRAPIKWMTLPERVSAIENFSYLLSRTSDNWVNELFSSIDDL